MSLAAPLPEGLFFDLVSAEEVEAVHLLEIQGKPPLILIYALYVTVRSVGFSPDEAATLEQLRFRQKTAPDLFLGAFVPQTGSNRTLLGYVDGVLSAETTLTSESMSTHVPGAHTVLIHGVCVTPDARKRGIASALLGEYQQRLAAAGSYERVLLISHEETIAFYERIGFKSRGLSSIAFAGVPWFELEWAVPSGQLDGSQGAPQAIPSGVLEALQGQNVSRRRQGQLLSSFPDGISDVSEKDDQRSNRYDLLCINERCGSIILRQGVAVLQERESVQMEPADAVHPYLPAVPSPPDKIHWWLVTPSPMSFENIGFSKPTQSEKPLKLLACAECDLGPVGWCEPGGNEFWVACQRRFCSDSVAPLINQPYAVVRAGRVYKAQSKDEDDRVHAIKKFKPDKDGNIATYTGISQSAIREIALNREICHENIVALKEVILEDKSIYMVFEYAEHDFLANLLLTLRSIAMPDANCTRCFPHEVKFGQLDDADLGLWV